MSDSPASHRLRTGRYAEPNRIYLLTTNTLGREPVFADYALGRLVVHQFRQAQSLGLANSLAWVVMPDHFHWLVELEKCSLSSLMRQTKSLTTREVNLSSARHGPIRCGMRFGSDPLPSCRHRGQARSHRDMCRSQNLNSTLKIVGASLLANGLDTVYRSGSHPFNTNRIIVCAAAS